MENNEKKNFTYMQLGAKDVLLIVLVAALLFMGWWTFFKGDNTYRRRIKELEQENRELKELRVLLDADIARRKAAFDSLSQIETQLIAQLAALEVETKLLRDNVKISRSELEAIRQRSNVARQRIADAKKNPIKRSGVDLINSIKIKTTP